MKKRILYDEEFYSKLLKEETINISKNFNTSEFWGDKVNEGVLIAYDFIPSNKKLKLLEMNTNIGIFKEYIPYFDFNGFSSFCKKNKYKKVIGVVNKHWYNRGYGTRSSTPSRDFMSLLESMLHKCGVKFELFSAPKYPESIPEIDTDKNTFILRFSFDPDSKIDSLAADKNLFREHIEKYGLSSLLPSTGNNLLEKKYKNKSFPDVVLKNPKLDRRLGIEFRKLPYNLENENENFVEKFIISDKIEGLDEYNLEIRGMALVTNNNVIVLNTEPFMDAKRYILNKDNSLQQINAHGTSFIEDTMIELASGRKKKIQYVKSGDKVISYDIKDLDKNKSWRDWIKMNWDGLDTLKTVHADVGGSIRKKTLGYVLINNKFKVTKNAALCVSDKRLKWKFKSALDVIVGDTVLLSGNEFVEVVSKEISDDIVNSYGIDIHDYNNYFGDKLLAHNIGVGAWCFIAGTKISMSNGTKKNIEDVRIGDRVLSWDENDNKIKSSIVCRLQQPIHNDMVNIKFGNEIENVNTFDHPYYVKNKGWSSYRPDLTMSRYEIGEIKQIEVGDICYYNNNGELEEIKIFSIEEKLGKVKTYIIEIENYNTFFANDILTHNKDGSTSYSYLTAGRDKCFMPDQLINMSDGTYKKISDVVIGDEVNTYNIKTTEIESLMVNEIMTKLHDDVYELHLANGKILKPTGNHPFLTKNKDWTTIDGHNPNHAGGSEYLEVGNYVKDIKDGWVRVNKIVGIEGEHLTYNFIDMKNGTIIADDIVTHNSSRRNHISYFNVQTWSSSGSDKGDDIATRQYVSAAGTNYYIWNFGGYPSPKNWISYFGTDTTTGNASDRGDLYNGCQAGCGTTEMPDTSNNYGGDPYVYDSGGQNGGRRNVIQYFNGTTTSGNSSDVGDLTQSKSFGGGMSGITYSFHCGGLTACFLPNQLINMSNGTYKKISDIELSDKVLVWDVGNKKVVKNIVNEIHTKLHDDVYELHLENGKILKPTGNHPFLTKNKDWTTIDGHNPNHAGGNGYLKVGDYVKDIKDGWVRINKIETVEGEYLTYNFIDMKNGTIIADDIVTHNSTVNVIENWSNSTYSTNASDRGDLIGILRHMGGSNTGGYKSAEIGNIAGGHDGSSWHNEIQYLDLASQASNSADKGDLTETRGHGGVTSGDDFFFYAAGVSSGASSYNTIDYWDIVTYAQNAKDSGDNNVTIHGYGGAAGYSGNS